jgi:hypothetical protein
MQKLKQYFKARRETRMKKNETEAQRTVLEELFNDIYRNRVRIYKVNFVRGILFGAGSALGGTIVIALIVWMLSLFVHLPVIGELFEGAQQSIERTTNEATQE